MMNREKVIKDLEECLRASCRGFRPRLSCPYNDEEWDIMREALALLKEREEKYNKLAEWSEGHIVFCKDCKHYRKGTCSAGAGMAFPPPDDWFCADGERKDTE